MIAPELVRALHPVLCALEALGVRHYLVGSVASSLLGKPRLTIDADLVAQLRCHHAPLLREKLERDYYADEEMIGEAIERRRSFNLVHYETALKIDVYVPRDDEYAQSALDRAAVLPLALGTEAMVGSPEDVLLYKLYWFRLGGEVSDRQWADVVGIVEVQASLDGTYLRRWAHVLGVSDLLERVLLP